MIYPSVKRATDIVVAALGLLTLGPVIAVLGIAVKVDSKGPAFFKSRRVGRGFKEFDLLKLRTMTTSEEGRAVQVTAGNDKRITDIGRVLRKTKLDELPQLVNVLTGDISLVGPRPEAPVYVAQFRDRYEKILSVRPGLTDRATLTFIDEEDILSASSNPEKTYIEEILPRKIEMYSAYVDKQGFGEDARILSETTLRLIGRSIGRWMKLDKR